MTEFSALALASIALILAAGTAGIVSTLLAQLRASQAALEAERQKFATVTAEASKANTSLGERVLVLDDRVNALDFFIKTGNSKK